MIKIKVSNDFTDAPGGRYAHEGTNSGEEFRIKILAPAYKMAKSSQQKIEVDLDDAFGYLPSFIDEAFGGLARENPDDDVLSYFQFISNDEPALIDRIKACMRISK